MCIAIYKPKDRIISEEKLRNCMANNDDGAGFAIVEKDENGKDELNVYKGYFEFGEFWEEWEPHQDKQALLHFRIATHALIDGQNCHPFRVNDDLALIHNGRLSSLPDNDEVSDTGVFCEKIIKPLAKAHPDFWLNPQFQWFIDNAIGSGNKLVFMDVQGRHAIFNESAGNVCDGVWYSNFTYNYRKNSSPMEAWERASKVSAEIDDIIDGKTEPQESNANCSGTADFEFQTSNVDEIDRILEKYQKQPVSLV